MKEEVIRKADEFIADETEFHLGFLPTEQSNPLTASMERDFAEDSVKGVSTLQRPDRDVLAMARTILGGAAFRKMLDTAEAVVRGGGRIVFSGCGATGRLSILLESVWRDYFLRHPDPRYGNSVWSIMTGGDFALVKSVESFEDYQVFGRRQVEELDFSSKDMLLAITEGGETSSVLGTLFGALDAGGKGFLLFNNPAPLLAERLERSRKAIRDPRVGVLDLYCGPMALAGSTRMQATTSEQLVAGALLEELIARLYPERQRSRNYAEEFAKLLDVLESPDVRRILADWIDFESRTYREKGRITYFADNGILDLFTDTTERTPTFMLPAFHAKNDSASPEPWALVKNPLYDTVDGWWHMLGGRAPRCLAWKTADYEHMNAEEKLRRNPPSIQLPELYAIEIGNEPVPFRSNRPADCGCLVELERGENSKLEVAYRAQTVDFPNRRTLKIATPWPDSELHLLDHLAMKLYFNTISTGTMAKIGRVKGNWMSFVSISNKKLIDRAIRLVSELAEVDYRTAAIAVFEVADEQASSDWTGKEKPSPVQVALTRLAAVASGKSVKKP